MVLARPPFNTGDRMSLLEGPTTKHKTQHALVFDYWTEASPRTYQTREFRSQDAESPCGRITEEILAVAMAGQQYVGSR
ncbi:hypothetical protein V1478_016950 [Vespula squamosa]|uniref:Uncharacterized protein n=1 Tax=Vespula squamosa TaxID=30214 RepID=A0ABD1ZXY8_VESSQ